MRAWENRPDTAVIDEPLYAHYLLQTGLDHPGRDEILAAYETDLREVAALITGPVPGGRAIFYQKHMTHHLLPEFDNSWLDSLTNAFLIREPCAVLASYIKKRNAVTLVDTGLPRQVEIFDTVSRRTGRTPPVIDAADLLAYPRRTLTLLCQALDVPFSERMLSWPPGRRSTDGVWAKYWYDTVEGSTCFQPPDSKEPVDLPPELKPLAAACAEYYEQLSAVRLT